MIPTRSSTKTERLSTLTDLLPLGSHDQLEVWKERAKDPKSVIPTGLTELDGLLRRGGFSPSTLVLLGGRTGTRKTTLMVNLIRNLLDGGYGVGLVGLDEALPTYVAKLASAMFGRNDALLEEEWDSPSSLTFRKKYEERASKLTMSKGYRPSFDDLSAWLHVSEMYHRPDVVFVDYVSLLGRDRFAGAEVQRIPRLIEELHVWTKEHELVTIALHQVGRMDEGTGGRYHGDTPMSLEGLKYGGEEMADVVLATYRPARDPVGNMTYDEAMAYLPENWKQSTRDEVYGRARERVQKYRASTFLQLLKNRPGTKTDERGIELQSVGDTMVMRSTGEALRRDMRRG